MNTTKTFIYNTLKKLSEDHLENHAQIRQSLYEELSLPFNQQIDLYTNVLAPISSGRCENMEKALDMALLFVTSSAK